MVEERLIARTTPAGAPASLRTEPSGSKIVWTLHQIFGIHRTEFLELRLDPGGEDALFARMPLAGRIVAQWKPSPIFNRLTASRA